MEIPQHLRAELIDIIRSSTDIRRGNSSGGIVIAGHHNIVVFVCAHEHSGARRKSTEVEES